MNEKSALSSWSLYNRKGEVNLRKTKFSCLRERGWAKYFGKKCRKEKVLKEFKN